MTGDGTGVELVDAVAKERDALDQVLVRSRAVLLVQTAGEAQLLERAVADLDRASQLLSDASERRQEAAVAVTGHTRGAPTASALLAAVPDDLRPVLASHIDRQRSTVAEIAQINGTITSTVDRAQHLLARRRRQLEDARLGSVTYRP